MDERFEDNKQSRPSKRTTKMSRMQPFKYNKKRHQKLVEHIRSGNSLKNACALVGLDPATLRRWMTEAKDNTDASPSLCALRLEIKEAQAESEDLALQQVRSAANDHKQWTAAAWYLERCVRGRYAKPVQQQVNISGAVSLADIAAKLELDTEPESSEE